MARSLGARVVAAGELPSGWRGKAWACHRGAAEATGDVLVFLDADTRMSPGGLRRLRYALEGGVAAVSVCPYQDVPQPHEQLSAFFVLMMAAGVGAFTIPMPARKLGMFGQCLAIRREAYARAGGHEAVKNRTLENLFLSQRLRAAGVPYVCYGGRDVLHVRMYPHDARELAEGWSKAFVSGAAVTPPLVMSLAVAWLFAAALVVAILIETLLFESVLSTVGWLGAYTCFAVQIGVQLRRLGAFAWYAAACYPVPLFFYMGVFGAALANKRLRGGRAEWKGRPIDG
jgi:4,4'-diaponeurosporenoate glycosyltransferase